MPITIKHGSIFDSTAQVLVCPVNCVGVMGKGLALEFKKRFPTECEAYERACTSKMLGPGQVLLERDERWICFAATKGHWRKPSNIEYVDECLTYISEEILLMYIFGTGDSWVNSIAIPQLGCGCGGLDWADVWPLYERHLGALSADVEVWIYE